MTKLDLTDALMSPSELLDWFMNYYDSLDESGRERLGKRLDMDNYDPRAMEPAVLKKRLEEQTLEMERDLDPEGPYMQSVYKKIGEEVDWITAPWWKKVLVKVSVMKKVISRTVEHGEGLPNNHSK